ncbi:ABC transporter ATP-binding protein [Desertihabitans brevis]|uniref:ABC transporter ATP-binding protein n=1 Tax=Desertihabitans brevis TaxID=2268447 RepID=A0A367YZN6_9ACTN|nr:ABC transporter ATP-binding protein [Desertihabitans brevis]RCK70411.1 ABC transporter ATP-binding protein [Desertihabitans brevis]
MKRRTPPAAATGRSPLWGPMFRRHRRPLALGYLLATTHQVCEALVPVAAGYVIGIAVATSSVPAILLGVGAILLLFAVLASAAAYGYYLIGKAAVTEAHLQRVAVVRRILGDPTVGRDRQAGELLSITSSDTQGATQLMETVGGLLASTVGLTVAAVVLLRIDLVLGLGVLVMLTVLVGGVRLLSPYLERRLSARQQAVGLSAAVASDLLTGLRSLRGFGGVAEAVRRYRTASRLSLDATVRATTSNAVVGTTSRLATGALVVLTAAVAAGYAVEGRISLAELVTVIGMATFLLDPIGHITRSVQELAVSWASGRRVAELLTLAPSETAAHDERPDGPLRLTAVVDDGLGPLSLTLAPGELLGVVTTDVATADTLSELLAGSRAPAAGTVRLGDAAVADLEPAAVRSRLLVEPHAVHLLGGSLAAALDTGDGADRQVELPAALDAAALRVEDLTGHADAAGPGPALGDIALLDHGANLSGGQRQRVALARALLADRDLLVLRDPTSAVDAVTEDAIAAGLRRVRAGRRSTAVLTTSPLLLSRCDRVLFIDADGASTTGSHADLLAVDAYRSVVLR